MAKKKTNPLAGATMRMGGPLRGGIKPNLTAALGATAKSAFTPGGKRNQLRDILRQKIQNRRGEAPQPPRAISGSEGIHSANADLDIAAPLPPGIKKR